jgi:hemoglobin
MRTGSTFEAVGGFARVRLIVSDFYDRLLESDRLAPFFAHVDMRRLIDHQTKFISAVMGGPAAFSDEQMKRVHLPLDITNDDFDEMVEILTDTLEDFGIQEPVLGRLRAQVLGMRELVVESTVPHGE